MAGIFPRNGLAPGVDNNGIALVNPNAGCEAAYYSTRCSTKIDPEALNNMLRELVTLFNCAGINYNCGTHDNLSRAVVPGIQAGGITTPLGSNIGPGTATSGFQATGDIIINATINNPSPCRSCRVVLSYGSTMALQISAAQATAGPSSSFATTTDSDIGDGNGFLFPMASDNIGNNGASSQTVTGGTITRVFDIDAGGSKIIQLRTRLFSSVAGAQFNIFQGGAASAQYLIYY